MKKTIFTSLATLAVALAVTVTAQAQSIIKLTNVGTSTPITIGTDRRTGNDTVNGTVMDNNEYRIPVNNTKLDDENTKQWLVRYTPGTSAGTRAADIQNVTFVFNVTTTVGQVHENGDQISFSPSKPSYTTGTNASTHTPFWFLEGPSYLELSSESTLILSGTGVTNNNFQVVGYTKKDVECSHCKNATVKTITTKEATCTEEGETKYYYAKCDACGMPEVFVKTEPIAKIAHTPGDKVTTKAATCTEEGAWEIRCTECNELLDSGVIAKIAHTPGDKVTTKDATCTEEGAWEIRCTECNELLDSGKLPKAPCGDCEICKPPVTPCDECGKTPCECQTHEGVTVEIQAVDYSEPTYTGSGSSRRGATTVTLTFELSDGTINKKEVKFSGAYADNQGRTFNLTQTVEHELGCYTVKVKVDLEFRGEQNHFQITGAKAEITESVKLADCMCDE